MPLLGRRGFTRKRYTEQKASDGRRLPATKRSLQHASNRKNDVLAPGGCDNLHSDRKAAGRCTAPNNCRRPSEVVKDLAIAEARIEVFVHGCAVLSAVYAQGGHKSASQRSTRASPRLLDRSSCSSRAVHSSDGAVAADFNQGRSGGDTSVVPQAARSRFTEVAPATRQRRLPRSYVTAISLGLNSSMLHPAAESVFPAS